MTQALEWTPTSSEVGQRIDKALATAFPQFSRSSLKTWLDQGQVKVNDKAVDPAYKLLSGDSIAIYPQKPEPTNAFAESIPLEILFEDEHLAVLNKPAGMVVHRGAGHHHGTLVNALLGRYGTLPTGESTRDDTTGESGRPGSEGLEDWEALGDRPGIVHRLDKDTSGVMVIARSVPAREGLMALFEVHDLEREYQAIVLGVPKVQRIETMIGRDPLSRFRYTGKVEEGKRAVTHITSVIKLAKGVLKDQQPDPLKSHFATGYRKPPKKSNAREYSLVRVRLETGRTHQIRVHLSELGFPLIGDGIYRGPGIPGDCKELWERFGRQALHAAVLGFKHPVTGAALRFEAPLPPDMSGLVSQLTA